MSFEYLIQRIERLSRKYPKERIGFTIGTITEYDQATDFYLTPIRSSNRIVYTGAIVRNVETALKLVKIVDSKVAYIFVDSEKKVSQSNYGTDDAGNIEKAVAKSDISATLLTYKGNDLAVQAADTLLRVLTPNLTGAKIVIAGVGNIGMKLALSLLERGNSVHLYSQDSSHAAEVSNLLNKLKLRTTLSSAFHAKTLIDATRDAQVLIATSNKKKFIGLEHISVMKSMINTSRPLLIDVGKGCFKDEISDERNVVMRVDVGDELSSEIDSLITQFEFQNSSPKLRTVGDTRFVVRGIVGKKGDVVVDNLPIPSTVLGKCDGDGNLSLVSEAEVFKLLKKIKENI